MSTNSKRLAAAAALLLLADRSAFLDPPANSRDTLAPDATAQGRLLAAVGKIHRETLPRLPNLIATRSTFSFDDSPEEIGQGRLSPANGNALDGCFQDGSLRAQRKRESIDRRRSNHHGGSPPGASSDRHS